MGRLLEKKIGEIQKLLVINRIKILASLLNGEMCVCRMVEEFGMRHNLLSHHLKTLVELNYLESRRNGQHIIYSINKKKKNIIVKILNLIN